MKMKNLLTKSSTVLLLSAILGTSIMPKTNAAVLNGGFETGNFNNWSTTGDASVQTGGPFANDGDNEDFNQIAPFEGSFHALITTACVDTTEIPGGFCGNSPSGRGGNDDEPAPAGRFEFSNTGVINATTDSELTGDAFALQNFLGLEDTALDAVGTDSVNAPNGNRQIKEGSAIKQTFTLTNPTNEISFAWAFLTNDFDEVELSVNEDGFEGRDFGFYTFYDTSSAESTRTINVLQESNLTTFDVILDDPSTLVNAADTDFRDKVFYSKVTLTGIAPGTYTLGFGVADGVGNDYTSALLVDNVQLEIPESSQLIGILGLGFSLCFMPKRKKR